MARQRQKATTTSKTSRNKFKEIPRAISPADIAKEFKNLVAAQCSTKLEVGFIAAEMLLHMGRGQMAAQLGHNFSHLSNADLQTIITETDILEYPASPNQPSTVEKLFLGFVKSIAHHDPALRQERWRTDGNSDLPMIAALSFLVGNLAWQRRAPNQRMSHANVKSSFDDVSSVHCPATTPTAGGGPFCDWMSL